MVSPLSSFVNNLIEGIHKTKCKHWHENKNVKLVELNIGIVTVLLNTQNLKMITEDLIEYKCLYCNKKYQHEFDKNLKESFFNTYKFSNNDNNKFILLLRKCIYPYEYMDDWEKSMRIYYLKKKIFTEDLIEYKCLYCNKMYQHEFDKNLKESFFNTYKFSNNDNNKFILLLRKCIYPYEYMDDWEKSMRIYYLKKKIVTDT